MTPKSLLRQEMRALLHEVSPAEISTASVAICQHLTALSPLSSSPPPTIAVFSAHGPEVQLGSMHHRHPRARLLYPLCHSGGLLTFHHVPSPSELTPGTLGILEPDPAQHSEIKISDIDLFLCPGLAFGQDHTRLGHGGGFYDRALTQRSSTAITIGISLDMQIRDSVPHDVHDIPLDHILTETGYLD